ncbi:hypothetical protein ACFFX0_15270 [Citricoccus parietis]|uniref:Uncharacterized protein n=1 Tax=Citricoccus parietis TaxID=592307 RepID=A0ABV5G0N1_9MICC
MSARCADRPATHHPRHYPPQKSAAREVRPLPCPRPQPPTSCPRKRPSRWTFRWRTSTSWSPVPAPGDWPRP